MLVSCRLRHGRAVAAVLFGWSMAALAPAVHAQRVYHVAVTGSNKNDGSAAKPFRTISTAAALAQSGDTITVHAGLYREWINPPRGGTSDASRITYQAAPGERVEVRGSEAVTRWRKVRNDTWKVVLPNTFFGAFNPYDDIIHGDWFGGGNRYHHTGEVYLNGDALVEAERLTPVLEPAGDTTFWFAQLTEDSTTIWAQFKGANPNTQLVEINARQAIFFPEKPGMNYITIRGFTLKHAATPWAPPTAKQVGLIGTHWSKGWIIENNTISDSKNSGIALGKYGDEWDNKAGSAEGYVGTIKRALENGWNRETIGHHIVRNNVIFRCGQTGIVGSMGAVFSTISDNVIYDIHMHQRYSGAEVAAIKFHGAVDVTIRHNHLYGSTLGIWLDWMAQGTIVEGNLMHDNRGGDLYVEVNHGPYFVNNNLFLSKSSVSDASEGGAFTHNLMAGTVSGGSGIGGRKTPYFQPHSTTLADLVSAQNGDTRFYNNIFGQSDPLSGYARSKWPTPIMGNVYLNGGPPAQRDTTVSSRRGRDTYVDPNIRITRKGDTFYLEFPEGLGWTTEAGRQLVTTALLGKAQTTGEAFENADGSPLRIDFDYFGKPRNASQPAAGPIESVGSGGRVVLQVWPRQ